MQFQHGPQVKAALCSPPSAQAEISACPLDMEKRRKIQKNALRKGAKNDRGKKWQKDFLEGQILPEAKHGMEWKRNTFLLARRMGSPKCCVVTLLYLWQWQGCRRKEKTDFQEAWTGHTATKQLVVARKQEKRKQLVQLQVGGEVGKQKRLIFETEN